MSGPRAIRGCRTIARDIAFVLIGGFALTALLIVLVNLVETLAHAHGWW